MPIYEFACPRCRVIFSFLSRRVSPAGLPACPRCASRDMTKQVTGFALIRARDELTAAGGADGGQEPPVPDFDDPKVVRAMEQMEQEMTHLDENNPRHMARMLRKMQEVLPAGSLPGDVDAAIRRLEAGEDPDAIEEEMGDLLGSCAAAVRRRGVRHSRNAAFVRDPALYDYPST